MIDDDVVPLEDDDIWVAFDDDFDDGLWTNVIVANILPPNMCILLLGLLDLAWHLLTLWMLSCLH
jgi:hypothetical protein